MRRLLNSIDRALSTSLRQDQRPAARAATRVRLRPAMAATRVRLRPAMAAIRIRIRPTRAAIRVVPAGRNRVSRRELRPGDHSVKTTLPNNSPSIMAAMPSLA